MNRDRYAASLGVAETGVAASLPNTDESCLPQPTDNLSRRERPKPRGKDGGFL